MLASLRVRLAPGHGLGHSPPGDSGARKGMRRGVRFEELIWFGALVGTPALMALGYVYAGTWAARRFGILDFAGDYMEGVLVAAALLLAIQFWPVPRAHRRALTVLWLVRIGVTLGAMLPYEGYYGLDANAYYRMGRALSDPWALLAFGQGTDNIRAAVGILSGLTGSYSAIKVIFAHVGLAAVYVFYRAAILALGRDQLALLYILGLFPSLLFWSSILGKDPPVLLGIAFFCYGAVGLIARHRLRALLWVVLGLLIASSIRIWLGVIFLAPLAMAYVLASRSSVVTKGAFVILATPLFLFALQSFADRFALSTAEDVVATADVISQGWARGGSAQKLESGFDSLGDMVAFAPIGAFTALFRPLPFEVMNPFGLLAGLENAAVLALLLMGLRRRGLRWLREPVLMWAALTVLTWGVVYGFVSYQNLGSAFRFRAQVVAILVTLVLALAFGHRRAASAGGAAAAGGAGSPGLGARLVRDGP